MLVKQFASSSHYTRVYITQTGDSAARQPLADANHKVIRKRHMHDGQLFAQAILDSHLAICTFWW